MIDHRNSSVVEKVGNGIESRFCGVVMDSKMAVDARLNIEGMSRSRGDCQVPIGRRGERAPTRLIVGDGHAVLIDELDPQDGVDAGDRSGVEDELGVGGDGVTPGERPRVRDVIDFLAEQGDDEIVESIIENAAWEDVHAVAAVGREEGVYQAGIEVGCHGDVHVAGQAVVAGENHVVVLIFGDDGDGEGLSDDCGSLSIPPRVGPISPAGNDCDSSWTVGNLALKATDDHFDVAGRSGLDESEIKTIRTIVGREGLIAVAEGVLQGNRPIRDILSALHEIVVVHVLCLDVNVSLSAGNESLCSLKTRSAGEGVAISEIGRDNQN